MDGFIYMRHWHIAGVPSVLAVCHGSPLRCHPRSHSWCYSVTPTCAGLGLGLWGGGQPLPSNALASSSALPLTFCITPSKSLFPPGHKSLNLYDGTNDSSCRLLGKQLCAYRVTFRKAKIKKVTTSQTRKALFTRYLSHPS